MNHTLPIWNDRSRKIVCAWIGIVVMAPRRRSDVFGPVTFLPRSLKYLDLNLLHDRRVVQYSLDGAKRPNDFRGN
jgi:hypothetical protein